MGELSERLSEIVDRVMRLGVHAVGLHEMREMVKEVAQLENKLAAHIENEGDECPLCQLEEENKKLREDVEYFSDSRSHL